ncbi:unnamed protein product, partial [Meganyctiphanes norvegica]
FVFIHDVVSAVGLPDPDSEPEDGTSVAIAGWGYGAEQIPARATCGNSIVIYNSARSCKKKVSGIIITNRQPEPALKHSPFCENSRLCVQHLPKSHILDLALGLNNTGAPYSSVQDI